MRKALGFIRSFCLNILLNIRWAVPGIVLLILHFTVGPAIKWSMLAFTVFIIYVAVLTVLMYRSGKGKSLPDKDYGLNTSEGSNKHFDEMYGFKREKNIGTDVG